MKHFVLILLGSVVFTLLPAQNWSWAETSSSQSFARIDGIALNESNQVYVCGTYADNTSFGPWNMTTSASWNTKGFIGKYSPMATWNWVISDTNLTDIFDIETDTLQNFFIAAYGPNGYVLQKRDSSGTLIWNYQMPLGGVINDLVVDNAGNSWIVGRLTSAIGIFGTDTITTPSGIVVRFDPNGVPLGATAVGRHGGINPKFLELDASGNYVIAATLSGIDTLDAQPLSFAGNTLLLTKIDQSGTPIWITTGDAPAPGNASGDPFGLCKDGAGDYYVTGGFATQDFVFGNDTVFILSNVRAAAIIKFDDNGNELWLRQANYTGTGSVYFQDAVSGTYNIYFSGYAEEDFSLGSVSVLDTSNVYQQAFVIAIDGMGNVNSQISTSGNNSKAIPCALTSNGNAELVMGGLHRNGPHFGTFALPPAVSGADDAFLIGITEMGDGIEESQVDYNIMLSNGNSPKTFVLNREDNSPDGTLLLYDLSGRIVKTIPVTSAQTLIDCNDLASGIYTWAVFNSAERLAAGKIVNQ